MAGKDAGESEGSVRFKRHRPEQTLLYRLIEQYYPDVEMQWALEGRVLPNYVRREFDEFLKCGRLEHGFLRVQCESCHAEHLVAFSCKRRGFCPSCCARRMVESAALLVDETLPSQPMRIFREYLQVKRNFTGRHFMARGYCVSKVGLDEQMIREYIRNQEREENRQEQIRLAGL